jgi:hypothetical protein
MIMLTPVLNQETYSKATNMHIKLINQNLSKNNLDCFKISNITNQLKSSFFNLYNKIFENSII